MFESLKSNYPDRRVLSLAEAEIYQKIAHHILPCTAQDIIILPLCATDKNIVK
jgi:hypothetical protein